MNNGENDNLPSVSLLSKNSLVSSTVMVPRRAPRVGSRRIDAALDALKPMGFPERKINRTIHNLLKTYGGECGWTFIEEGYYKLVIDTMIEDEDDDPKSKAGSSAGSSAENSPLKDDSLEEETGEHDNSQHAMQLQVAALPPSIDTRGSMEVDAQAQSSQVDSLPKKDIDPCSSSRSGTPQDKHCLMALPPIPDEPGPSRRPCYGWISSDDDEDDDLVHSTPAT